MLKKQKHFHYCSPHLPVACSPQEVAFRSQRSSFSFYDSADPSDGKVDGFSDGEKKCTICSQVFTTDSQLQKHLREHESNDKVTTAVGRGCRSVWSTVSALKNHTPHGAAAVRTKPGLKESLRLFQTPGKQWSSMIFVVCVLLWSPGGLEFCRVLRCGVS